MTDHIHVHLAGVALLSRLPQTSRSQRGAGLPLVRLGLWRIKTLEIHWLMLQCYSMHRALRFSASACFLMLACDDATGPGNPVSSVSPDVRGWVTGEAATQLDSDGHFILPAPAPPGAEPIISEERAELLAIAFIRTFLWSNDKIGRAHV